MELLVIALIFCVLLVIPLAVVGAVVYLLRRRPTTRASDARRLDELDRRVAVLEARCESTGRRDDAD